MRLSLSQTTERLAVTLLTLTCLQLAGTISYAGAVYDAGKNVIEVTGDGNTLGSIAEDLRMPDRFRYVQETRTAVTTASIWVAESAQLVIGNKQNAGLGETLQLQCAAGDAAGTRFVRVKGALDLYHSTIAGIDAVIKPKKRYRVQNGLRYEYGAAPCEIVDSSIRGAQLGLRIYKGAAVSIDGLTVSDCAIGAQLYADLVVRRLDVSDTRWGLRVQHPLELVQCDLGEAPLVLDRSNPKLAPVVLRATDTAVNPRQVEIRDDAGESRVRMQWRQFIATVDEQDYVVPDVLWRLTSIVSARTLPLSTGRTDGMGRGWIAVPQSDIMRGEKGLKTVDYENQLDIRKTGEAAGWVSARTPWLCVKNKGLQVVLVAGGGLAVTDVPYRQAPRYGSSAIDNQFPNSSFEIDTVSGFPDYWWPDKFFETRPGKPGWGVIGPDSKELVFFGIDKSAAHHGEQSLKMPPRAALEGYAANRLQFNRQPVYTVSFFAKAEEPDSKLTLRAQGLFTQTFAIKTEWLRYSVTWREAELTDEQRSGRFYRKSWLNFINAGAGYIWLDAAQVETRPGWRTARSLSTANSMMPPGKRRLSPVPLLPVRAARRPRFRPNCA
jgi:hypothetical protein